MENIFLLAITILPSLLIVTSFYFLDREKESIRLLLKLFLGGAIATVLVRFVAIIIEIIMPVLIINTSNIEAYSKISILIYSFLVVALTEETSKWLVVNYLAKKSREFDEGFDGIVYAITASIGFALIENILYVILGGGADVAMIRAITSTPAHALFGIFMGYYFGLSKYRKDESRKKILTIFSLLVPILLHGAYDYFAFTLNSLFYIFLYEGILMIISIIAIINLRRQGMIEELLKNKYCLDCGAKAEESICSKCNNIVS